MDNDLQSSMTRKIGHDDDEEEKKEENIDLNDHRPLVEFGTASYAILEREQRVDVKVKRSGPIDVEFRFRCLSSTRLFNHLCALMLHNIFIYILILLTTNIFEFYIKFIYFDLFLNMRRA